MLLGSSLKAVLLDVDGTLIDSNHAHAASWQKALAAFGFEIPYGDIRTKIGMGGDHLLPALTGLDPERGEGKKISERRGEIFRSEYLPTLKAFPGTREMLMAFREREYRLVVATSASRTDLAGLLKQCSLEEFMDRETSSSDADRSKPEPDIVLAALERAGAKRDQAVMLGDTPYDLEAAGRAGVKAIAFTCGGWEREALQAAEEIYAGPWELAEKLKPARAGIA